jgi:hypothetical protein
MHLTDTSYVSGILRKQSLLLQIHPANHQKGLITGRQVLILLQC